MSNLILVCFGVFIIAAMVLTSNMERREKIVTLLAMIGIEIFLGFVFTTDCFYLIGCTVVGVLLGHWVNVSIINRRAKVMKNIMADKNISV